MVDLVIQPHAPLALPEGPLLSDEQIAQLYRDFLSGRTQTTLDAYQGDLVHFAGYVSRYAGDFETVETPQSAVKWLISMGHGSANLRAMQYRNWMVDSGRAAATINRRLSALRSICDLANRIGFISWALNVDGVKNESARDMSGPSDEDTLKLFAYAEAEAKKSGKGARDYAIVRLLYDIALRRAEVRTLDLAHFDGARVSIKGKGKRHRQWVTLPTPAREAVSRWVEIRGDKPGPLFPSYKWSGELTDNQMSGRDIWHLVKKQIGEKAGVKVRPHGLRHSAITKVLDMNNGDPRIAQKFSRHADVNVLMRYDNKRRNTGAEIAERLAASTLPQRFFVKKSEMYWGAVDNFTNPPTRGWNNKRNAQRFTSRTEADVVAQREGGRVVPIKRKT